MIVLDSAQPRLSVSYKVPSFRYATRLFRVHFMTRKWRDGPMGNECKLNNFGNSSRGGVGSNDDFQWFNLKAS